LEARERLTQETAAFVAEVVGHRMNDTATVNRMARRKAKADFRWEGVEMRPYKKDERALYKTITDRCCFPIPTWRASCAIFRSRPAALDAGGGTNTCTAC